VTLSAALLLVALGVLLGLLLALFVAYLIQRPGEPSLSDRWAHFTARRRARHKRGHRHD
jgi:predicted histidine transporter YuiF (NhaC family)